MTVHWTSKEDEILINFVRDREILFNVKHKDYRKSHIKQKLWCEVAEILNKTDFECYKRWGYVRDYYIRRKEKPGSSGEAARNRSVLLSFLDRFPSPQRHSIVNVIDVSNGENTQNNGEQLSFQNQVPEHNIILEFNQEGDGFNKEEESSTDDTYIENDNSREESKIFREIKKEYKDDDNVKNNLKRKNESHTQEHFNQQKTHRKPSNTDEFDETDLFFRSMAKIVKKLPRYEQVQLRMEIGTLIGNVELRYIGNDPISVSPRSNTSSDC